MSFLLSPNCTDTEYDEEKIYMLGNLCNFNICGVATEIFKSLPTRYSIAIVGVNVLETIAFQSSMQ